MGANSLAENTPNAPEFIYPSQKVMDFNEKRLNWASVVRGSSGSNQLKHLEPLNLTDIELAGPFKGLVSQRI